MFGRDTTFPRMSLSWARSGTADGPRRQSDHFLVRRILRSKGAEAKFSIKSTNKTLRATCHDAPPHEVAEGLLGGPSRAATTRQEGGQGKNAIALHRTCNIKMSAEEASTAPVDEVKKVKKSGSAKQAAWTPKPAPTVSQGEAFDFKDKEGFGYIKSAQERNLWYYRDRLSVPRGPCTIPTLREAWAQGIIDENTLVWGQGQIDWLPIRNVRLLTGYIRTPEVRLSAWFRKTFVLAPALEKIRKDRAAERPFVSTQIEGMR